MSENNDDGAEKKKNPRLPYGIIVKPPKDGSTKYSREEIKLLGSRFDKRVVVAAIEESEIQQSLLDKLVQTAFKGSPLSLVLQALGHEKTSQEDLEEIKKIIKKIENNK